MNLFRITFFLGSVIVMMACANEPKTEGGAAADGVEAPVENGVSTESMVDKSDYITQELDWVRFQDLSMEIPGNLEIVQGDAQKIELYGPPNMMEEIQVDFNKEKVRFYASTQFKEAHEVDIKLVTPGLKYVYVLQNGDVNIDGRVFTYTDASFISRGVNNSKIHSLERDHLAVLLNGQGSINLSGQVSKLSAYINGEGDIKAYDLQANQTKAKITGKGMMELNSKDNLEVIISGNGKIYYKGQPTISDKITGAGRMVPMN